MNLDAEQEAARQRDEDALRRAPQDVLDWGADIKQAFLALREYLLG